MDRTIAAWRLRNQRLSAPQAATAAESVELLLCVQAENPSQSAWAVACRTATPDAGDLGALLASGEVLRTHVLRSTWHYAGREDLDWLLALTGPRLLELPHRQLTVDLGLETTELDRLQELVLDVLAEESDRTRNEVAAAVRARLDPAHADRVTGRVVMLLMARLEMDRLVCSGRPRDGEHTYAPWADRVPTRVPLESFDREAALARLALRYLNGHGPATVKDLAYWATLTPTEARHAVRSVRDQLDSFEHAGRTYWHLAGDTAPGSGGTRPRGHLLQLLDETYRGYQDSRWVLDADGVVPRGREAAIGIALIDGQLVAGMKRTLTPAKVRFDLTPHRPLASSEVPCLEDAATRYADFLGLTPELRLL